jgi:uncharacterized integral membrane protein
MKIIGNLFKILVLLLLFYILIQNGNQIINLKLFTLEYSDVPLAIILLLTLGIGAILGVIMMSFSLINSRTEVRELKRTNRQLTKELENLRNISIDDIPEGEISESTDLIR